MVNPTVIRVGDDNKDSSSNVIETKPLDVSSNTQLQGGVDETDWSSVRLISVILFFGMIQMTVIGMSEWPYMAQIDPVATSTFFGYVGSASSLGHAIFAPLMGYWSSATGQTKLPLIAGRLIALVGCVLYICVEMFPTGRRFVMLICYTIFGISMSSVSVMRGYVAKISTVQDRAMAVSLFGLATMLAVTMGPVFQLLFTSLSYPGYVIIGEKIRLNIYTGPIYVATIANIISLSLVLFVFKEKRTAVTAHMTVVRKTSRAVAALTTDMRAFNLPLAISCIVARMAATLTVSVIHTTTTPLMTSAFGWTGLYTVRVSSYTQAVVGVLSLIIFSGFASGKLTKFLSERLGALISMILFASFFLITFPWHFVGFTIPIKDAANNVSGCNPVVYKWCLDSVAVSPVIYVGAMMTVLGLAFTLTIITTDTLYSKILGNIDQSTMQGIFLFSQDIISICGPLLIAPTFTATGQRYIWMATEVAIILVILRWLRVYKRLPKSETILGKWFKNKFQKQS